MTIYGKEINIRENVKQAYREIYQEELSDMHLQYFAVTSDCTPQMSAEELQEKIEDAITEELGMVLHAPYAIEEAKEKGTISDD